MLTINQELQQGRYRITKQFGQGKTVSFYEALDKILEKNILLKKLLVKSSEGATPAEQEAQKNAFANEAKFLTDIKHEGFLQVFNYFSDVDSQYLVMELVDGKNVGELLKKNQKPFALSDIVDWGEQMLHALEYLHQKTPSVIYFNVKPLNIHLTSRGKIKLLATGIAARSEDNADITKQAFDAANLNYSPLELIWVKLDSASQRVILNDYDDKSEQILTQPPDVRSDIYSLGATLYHLLTEKLPVDALERSIEILEGNPDPLIEPHEVNPNIAVEISDVLMKALKIRRENRLASAAEMRQELNTAFAQLKERKAKELRSEVPAAPAAPVIRAKPTPQKDQNINLELPKIKSEESKQLELIKQKLREAEEQRLLAEQRAAEAERRLLVMETQEFKLADILETEEFQDKRTEFTAASEAVNKSGAKDDEEVWQEDFTEDSAARAVSFEEKISDKPPENSAEEFTLFAEPPKKNKFMKRMAAVAVGIIMLGGGIFGVLKFLPSASAGMNPNATSQSVSGNEPAADIQTNVEATPETETTPEMSEAQNSGEILETKQIVDETSVKPPPVKEKPAVPQIATVKTPEPPKSAVTENQKKKVTVDDLINDKPKKKVTVDDLINNN